jgi:hypothetical protein
MTSVNLLEDTITMLTINKKTINDVLFVRTRKQQCSFAKFAELVKDFKYINSFGCYEINLDLVVVGRDFWLERKEYDGTEQWVFKSVPACIKNTDTIDFRCWFCSGEGLF